MHTIRTASTDDAKDLKSMSMKERLAMWKKHKEQTQAQPQKPSIATNSTGEINSSSSNSSSNYGNHSAANPHSQSRESPPADNSKAGSERFVTAPCSVASEHSGTDSPPATPMSGMSLNSPLGSGSRPAKPLGGLLKPKLAKPGLGSRRRLLQPSSLRNSVFGADSTSEEVAQAGSGGPGLATSGPSHQKLRRPLLSLADMEADAEKSKPAPGAAMDVDSGEAAGDSLEEFMKSVAPEAGSDNAASSGPIAADSAATSSAAAVDNQTNALNEGDANDSDGIPEDSDDVLALAARRLKKKELAPVDHSKMNYEAFKKDFYIEPADMRNLTQEEVDMMRVDLGGIKVRGVDPPKPATSWSHFGLPAACADVIRSQEGLVKPTPIQAQAVPAILSGRDVIGVAKTGSGKTLAFILPMLRHIKAQRPLAQGEGPIGLVMTPTRELAVQIHRECKPFLKPLGLRAVCAYGGSAIKDQIGELKRGAEIVVCTPGRMIDLLCANSGRVTNLHRVTYLVLDEADRMFDMGFEPQVSKITQGVRPSRQTVLFSATFPRQMEALARKILRRPLEIVVGGRALIPPEVAQHVEVVENKDKFVRLLAILGQSFNDNPETLALVFVDRQEAADGLLRDLMRRGYVCNSLHGGKDQTDRDQAIADFKNRVYSVLIATSVAARGLDVRGLNVVVNYDCPNHMEDLVHRVGRTGRAGNKGDAFTFITPDQDRYASEVVKAMKLSGLTPPEDVQAMADAFIDKVRQGKERHSGKSGFGGKGLEKLDKERSMVKKIQKVTYGAAGGELVDDDDDEDEDNDDKADNNSKGETDDRRNADSDAEPTAASKRHRGVKSKDGGEHARRLSSAAGLHAGSPTTPVAHGAASPAALGSPKEPQQPGLPEGISPAARAALLAAQAAARRLNIDSGSAGSSQAAPVLSAVDLINQQLGTTTTPGVSSGSDTPLSAGTAAAAAVAAAIAPKMRASNSATKEPADGKEAQTTSGSGSTSAIIPVGACCCELDINDYPQKARWRATNRETLTQIIEQTGAAITTRGIFVPPGKPVPEGERKLYLTIESDSERSAEQAKSEIKRILTESTLQIMEQEARSGGATGRYSVV
ncbi:pre-mRNA processing RNA-helicase [Coemansia sp. Benny D115]|nr:pre-mRNA processing RNA-helicase [Coemansia sp. Benny D115]